MMDELKPCPFCGGEAEIETFYPSSPMRLLGWKYAYVECQVCGCRSGVKIGVDEAIETWNRRAGDSDD